MNSNFLCISWEMFSMLASRWHLLSAPSAMRNMLIKNNYSHADHKNFMSPLTIKRLYSRQQSNPLFVLQKNISYIYNVEGVICFLKQKMNGEYTTDDAGLHLFKWFTWEVKILEKTEERHQKQLLGKWKKMNDSSCKG